MINTKLTNLFNIDLPVIMAPMFLVSDENMVKAAVKNRIIGTFPTLNYRESDKLDTVLKNLNRFVSESENPGTYGVNIITQKSNPYYQKHLEICVKNKVPFFITSLGNPKEIIKKAHKYGAKVFCDVTNLKHAEKVVSLGADGIIAVGQGAGGHAGPEPLQILIPALKQAFPDTLIIAAGGISTGKALHSALVLGAVGASIGTSFIATKEAPVGDDYKNAIVNAKSEDIVMTTRISGTPSTIINTPYAKKIGYTQNWLEKKLSKNPRTKKHFKMLVQMKGMKKLEKSVKPGNYKNLWIAGKSVQFINEITDIENLILRLKNELEQSINENTPR
jgi:nitronate monooxygenase